MGVLIGIINAFGVSANNVFTKKLAGNNPFFIIWMRSVASLPILAGAAALFSAWEMPGREFWLIVVFLVLPTRSIMGYAHTKALHLSPISIIAPLSAFTSVFLVPVGYGVLGEIPSLIGFAGIVLVVAGSFFVAWQRGSTLRRNVKRLLHERGTMLALLGSLVASMHVSAIKLSFDYASPIISALFTGALYSLILTPPMFMRLRGKVVGRPAHFAALSATAGGNALLHYVGLSLLPAAYFMSIKRLSVLFNVALGKIVFNEDHIKERFAGAVLMLAGVVLIVIG